MAVEDSDFISGASVFRIENSSIKHSTLSSYAGEFLPRRIILFVPRDETKVSARLREPSVITTDGLPSVFKARAERMSQQRESLYFAKYPGLNISARHVFSFSNNGSVSSFCILDLLPIIQKGLFVISGKASAKLVPSSLFSVVTEWFWETTLCIWFVPTRLCSLKARPVG